MKLLKYLQEHPYWQAIWIILSIIGILPIIWWWITLFDNWNNDYYSIFDIIQKTSTEKTTLAKQELFKAYIGEKIKDHGFIVDIKKDNLSDYIVADILQTLEKDKNGSYKSQKVECYFTPELAKKFSSTTFPHEIDFSAQIPRYNATVGLIDYILLLPFLSSYNTNLSWFSITSNPIIELEDCSILN